MMVRGVVKKEKLEQVKALNNKEHYEAEPFEMSAGKKVNTREQPETNFICLSCYIEEHL